MSWVGAIGEKVNSRVQFGESAVRCPLCETLQTKYVNKNWAKRRTCKGCGIRPYRWYVGYTMPV